MASTGAYAIDIRPPRTDRESVTRHDGNQRKGTAMMRIEQQLWGSRMSAPAPHLAGFSVTTSKNCALPPQIGRVTSPILSLPSPVATTELIVALLNTTTRGSMLLPHRMAEVLRAMAEPNCASVPVAASTASVPRR